jgi:hypothetical protein
MRMRSVPAGVMMWREGGGGMHRLHEQRERQRQRPLERISAAAAVAAVTGGVSEIG